MPDQSTKWDAAAQQTDYPEALNRAASTVLETMFFTEAVATECEHSWMPLAVSVVVGFDGSHLGQMWLAIGKETVPALASAFLGLDPDEAGEVERSQVMLELGNILCGAMLSSLWPDSRLLLEAPKLAPWEASGEGLWHCCLMLPEGRLAISVRLVEVKETA